MRNTLEELAERFIGRPKSDDELKKFVNIIHKDINTLTTVSDDGEMAGSQFFDIDWSLLDAEGIVSATNSLGLERLAGISQQYLSMLTASVSYLAHSSCFRTSCVSRRNRCTADCASTSSLATCRG